MVNVDDGLVFCDEFCTLWAMHQIPSPDEKSPCINVCRLDSTHGFCEGCGRNQAEIGQWIEASRAEKIAIKQRAAARLEAGKTEEA